MTKPSIVLLPDNGIRIASDPDGHGNFTTVRTDGPREQEQSAHLIAEVMRCNVLDWRKDWGSTMPVPRPWQSPGHLAATGANFAPNQTLETSAHGAPPR